jgi:IMP dehydrogenase
MLNSIQGLIDRNIIVLHHQTTVRDAARAMESHKVGCVLVSSEHHIVGMVTDRDLAIHVLAYDQPADLPLKKVMTTNLICIDRTASVEDVLKVMEVNGVRRVPVLDYTRHGIQQCIGIVTLDDLLKIRGTSIDQASRIVKSQLMRRLYHPRFHHLQENREQTLDHFYKVMAQEMAVPEAFAERVTYFLLKEFLQKVPATNATHFISQLPSLIRSDMMNIPAGTDRRLKAKSMIEDLRVGFQLTEKTAHDLIPKFWNGLKKALNPEIVHYLEVILPKDFRALLNVHSPEEEAKFQDAVSYERRPSL